MRNYIIHIRSLYIKGSFRAAFFIFLPFRKCQYQAISGGLYVAVAGSGKIFLKKPLTKCNTADIIVYIVVIQFELRYTIRKV